MASWVTHLMIADRIVNRLPYLCKHEFCVGNIAPDCNVENSDWTAFTPPREVTHWMNGEKKKASDCNRFLHEYIETKGNLSGEEVSFLLGYYSHLVTDAEFQRFIRDEKRVQTSWNRIQENEELKAMSTGMDKTWDSVKRLIGGRERIKDIYTLERTYLDEHPESGYLSDILNLKEFPDYIDYFPKGAIVRKIKTMGYMPQKELGQYPFVAMSKEEYGIFLETAVKLVVEGIEKYKMKL